MNDDRRLIDAVDRVVREHGEYIPTEYLLAVGRLRYPEYEAWRCGEIETLEDVLIGNPERIAVELSRAAQRARQLGLVADQCQYDGWAGASSHALKFSRRANSRTGELCCTHFVRSEVAQTGQFDLFLDGGLSSLVHRVGNALIERRIDEAEALLIELEHRDRDHALGHALASLCAAQRELSRGAPVVSVALELERIESRLAPAAAQALGARARDLLAPFWRRLGDALEAIEFDPAHPRLHSSWAYGQVLDWPRVETSIREQHDWYSHFELHWRLALALLHQSRRREAIALWCRSCWSWPAAWETRMQADALPDPVIAEYWRDFQDVDIEPALSPDWFPVWILMQEKGLALALENLHTDSTAAQRGFEATRFLLTNTGKLDETTLAAPQSLRALHSGVFEYYLEHFATVAG